MNALWKGTAACAAMAAVLLLWLSWSVALPAWVVTLIGLALGVSTYGGLLILFKTQEIGILWWAISRRVLHKGS
jgi:hypothetical protein